MLFVAAAGNDGADNDLAYAPGSTQTTSLPASWDLPNIVSVAAVDNDGDLASFSNYGATTVDIAAPGVGILSTLPAAGMSFQGQLVLQALNEQSGLTRPLNGVVSGSESGIGVIDFDADIESTTRRHVGTIVADTIDGNWISAPDGTMSGTFRVVRETR